MGGYNLFLKQIKKMSISEQRKLIAKIFGKKVLVFSIDGIDGKIYIKFYDGNTYYQFVFVGDIITDDYLDIEISERIVVCKIFVNNLSVIEFEESNFYQFVKMLKSGNFNYFL